MEECLYLLATPSACPPTSICGLIAIVEDAAAAPVGSAGGAGVGEEGGVLEDLLGHFVEHLVVKGTEREGSESGSEEKAVGNM